MLSVEVASLPLSSHLSSEESSDLSEPTSWYKSRYVKAAAMFMMAGVAYMYDPNILNRIGDITVTLSPELRYINGPPPIWSVLYQDVHNLNLTWGHNYWILFSNQNLSTSRKVEKCFLLMQVYQVLLCF